MAIYTNITELPAGTKPVFESSLLKSTISGHIWDCLVVSESGSGSSITRTPIEVPNTTPVKVGGFTHNGNGLQERYAVIAGVKDKIGVVGTPALIKDNLTTFTGNETFFTNKAGVDAKVYEVYGDEFDGDIFGVTKEAFTTASQANIAVDNYVVLDGTGKYVAQTAKPVAANYGFIGQIHSLYTNNFYTMVRIYVLQNVDNNN